MPTRAVLALALSLVPTGALLAQVEEDRPQRHVPIAAPTAEEVKHRAALRHYAEGLVNERRSRLLEALRCYQQAEKVAPGTVEIKRSLVPLYIALDRGDDALEAARSVLELDTADHNTAYAVARYLRGAGRRAEAIEMLRLATKSPKLRERLDLLAQVWFDLSQMLELEGKLEEATASLRQVVAVLDDPRAMMAASFASRKEVDQQTAETYEKLGQLYLRQKKVAEAEKAFAVARKADPERAPRLAYDLARVYHDRGKHAEALAHLETFLRSMPSEAEPYKLRAKLQRATGAEKSVIPSLVQSSKRDQFNVGIKLLLGRELRKAKRPLEAELLYAEAAQTSPTPELFRDLFSLNKEQGRQGLRRLLKRLDRAIAATLSSSSLPGVGDLNESSNARTMLLVLRKDKDLVRLLLPLAAEEGTIEKLHVATRCTLAAQGARVGAPGPAEELFRSCLKSPDLGDMEAEAYAGLIQVLSQEHKNAALVEAARQGLEHAKSAPKVLFHRALAYGLLNLDRMKEALEAAEAAVSTAEKGQKLSCLKLKAHVLCEMGRGKEAVRECLSMVKEYNHGGEAREAKLCLARAYQAAGLLDESEKALQEVLDSDPSDATVCNDLGYLYADRNKKLAEAEKLIRKALELDRKLQEAPFTEGPGGEDNAAYVDSLGWVLYRQGKLDEAKKELERATKLPQGDDPVLWDHLGDVYGAMKQKGKAREAWEKAKQLYEAGARRKTEERYRSLQRKLKRGE